ncbi:tyrosine-type recombinase/integrase [Streptomyces sp. NBC_00525]|uniref:tyrosine-type recombinase/integrase n=1 Tax=Streptomyces sp. NBC_00525 TaxID=2903660 RepID=UPI002E8009F7|nr:tyrosine-type recombinase/integrase [Streptomyces sp. NBC_00525]WUC97399.1 site-specific integrase [Streptomyces sp. NBC_00525]
MSDFTLHDAVHTYLDALRNEGAPHGTIKQYRSVLYRLTARYQGRQYGGIKTKDLAQFLYGPDGITTGKAASTGGAYRAALRSFFAYGHLMGWGPVVVVPQPVIRQRSGRPQERPTRLAPTELHLMLQRCPDAAQGRVLRGMVAVAMNTALRLSDIVKIEIGHIDLAKGELAVWSQKTQRFNTWPITADLDRELRDYMTWYTATTGVTFADAGRFLFPGWGTTRVVGGFAATPEPSRHTSPTWANVHIHRLFEACGIAVESGEAWHTIRRSVARIYFDTLREEVSYDHALRQVSVLLDHANSATTERYLGTRAEKEAVDRSLKGKRLIPAPASGVIDMTRRAA